MPTYLVVVMIISINLVGDYLIKLASGSEKTYLTLHFVAGASLYALGAFGWLYVMKHESLAWVGVTYACGTVIGLTFIGYLFFDEPIRTSTALGLFLAIVAIYLVESSSSV